MPPSFRLLIRISAEGPRAKALNFLWRSPQCLSWGLTLWVCPRLTNHEQRATNMNTTHLRDLAFVNHKQYTHQPPSFDAQNISPGAMHLHSQAAQLVGFWHVARTTLAIFVGVRCEGDVMRGSFLCQLTAYVMRRMVHSALSRLFSNNMWHDGQKVLRNPTPRGKF
jgi:hypothetical protein